MSRVLVIDDDPGTLVGYKGILRSAGFDVTTVDSGREGLARAQSDHLSVVLADLRLPDLSGLDILRKLRASRITVPFVIVTGFGSPRSAVEAIVRSR